MSTLSSNVWHQKNEQLLTSPVFFAVTGMVEIGVALCLHVVWGEEVTALHWTKHLHTAAVVSPAWGCTELTDPDRYKTEESLESAQAFGYWAEAEVKHSVPLVQPHLCSSQVNTIFPAREIPSNKPQESSTVLSIGSELASKRRSFKRSSTLTDSII